MHISYAALISGELKLLLYPLEYTPTACARNACTHTLALKANVKSCLCCCVEDSAAICLAALPSTLQHVLCQRALYLCCRGGENEFKQLVGCSQKPGAVPFNGYWPGWGVEAELKSATECKVCTDGCLYDIRNDPYETTDLATARPDDLARLKARLAVLNKSIFTPDRGNQSITACEVAMSKYGGFYGPFTE